MASIVALTLKVALVGLIITLHSCNAATGTCMTKLLRSSRVSSGHISTYERRLYAGGIDQRTAFSHQQFLRFVFTYSSVDASKFLLCLRMGTCKRSEHCSGRGYCLLNKERKSFVCQCPKGHTGDNCERIDRCAISPCRNGGTCYNHGSSYACRCPMGFEGRTCTTRWLERTLFTSLQQSLSKVKHTLGTVLSGQTRMEKAMKNDHLKISQSTVGYPTSCQDEAKKSKSFSLSHSRRRITIDVDGRYGPLKPFLVECSWSTKAKQWCTEVHHDKEARTMVNGYEEAGSYEARLKYRYATLQQVTALVDQSPSCKQFVKYECFHSVMTWSGKPWAYWKNRYGKVMQHWGGGSPGKLGCACSITNSCAHKKKCNCDANIHSWLQDKGYLRDKANLPVTAVHFGDTGHSTEKGFHTVGPLICS